MWIHDQPLRGATPLSRPVDWADGGEPGVLRQPADWAVPLPCHIWHDRRYVALYGLDKSTSPGTIDFTPAAADGRARLRVYYPDSFPEAIPGTTKFAAGATLDVDGSDCRQAAKGRREPVAGGRTDCGVDFVADPAAPRGLENGGPRHRGLLQALRIVGAQRAGTGAGLVPQRVAAHRVAGGLQDRSRRGSIRPGLGRGPGRVLLVGRRPPLETHRRREPAAVRGRDDPEYGLLPARQGPGRPVFRPLERQAAYRLQLAPAASGPTRSARSAASCSSFTNRPPIIPTRKPGGIGWPPRTAIGNFLAEHQKPDGDLQDIFDPNDKEGSTQRPPLLGAGGRVRPVDAARTSDRPAGVDPTGPAAGQGRGARDQAL